MNPKYLALVLLLDILTGAASVYNAGDSSDYGSTEDRHHHQSVESRSSKTRLSLIAQISMCSNYSCRVKPCCKGFMCSRSERKCVRKWRNPQNNGPSRDSKPSSTNKSPNPKRNNPPSQNSYVRPRPSTNQSPRKPQPQPINWIDPQPVTPNIDQNENTDNESYQTADPADNIQDTDASDEIPTRSYKSNNPPTTSPSTSIPLTKDPTSHPTHPPTRKPFRTFHPTPSPTTLPSSLPIPSPTSPPTFHLDPSLTKKSPSLPTPSPNYLPTITPSQTEKIIIPPQSITYQPGNLTVQRQGLLLSTGLTTRIIAQTGYAVPLPSKKKYSTLRFHAAPDAGATFSTPDGGWIYVSNSENRRDGRYGGGGVGAITFDADGIVSEYRRVLSGTAFNCGGGKTPWNTWVSCEEDGEQGQCWEVDPTGVNPANLTMLTDGIGGNYESVAYDAREEERPVFFVTEDWIAGALRRFRPDPEVVRSGENWSILTEKGEVDYLVLLPDQNDEDYGTFTWDKNITRGQESAFYYFPNTEGIDFRDGKLYVTSKKDKKLFILDMDGGNYERTSTNHGAFVNPPDQIVSILGESGILYFCEDGEGQNGIHGRDSAGRFFTILTGPRWKSETTGLAFSPNRLHMYVAFQIDPGLIFDITREDGLPFDGLSLDIKYHAHTDE